MQILRTTDFQSVEPFGWTGSPPYKEEKQAEAGSGDSVSPQIPSIIHQTPAIHSFPTK